MKTKIRSVLISVALICSAAALRDARAVNPPPDGGYPNFNTAEGTNALKNLTTGAANTAVGWFSLFGDTSASFNTGVGAGTLLFNNGEQNTAVGVAALLSNTTGFANTAIGPAAGFNQTTGNFNVYIGSGMQGVAGENNACYIASIFGQVSAGGTAVFINQNSRLGMLTSSKRFKEEIKPMDQSSEALFALKPVTFHYKKEIDPARTLQFGLVAEDVETVNPALIVRDKEGNPYSVRYEQINAMLLNEFLKEHKKLEAQQSKIKKQEAAISRQQRKLQEQDTTIGRLERSMQVLTAQLKEQATQIQKVSAQVETSRSVPHVAVNNH